MGARHWVVTIREEDYKEPTELSNVQLMVVGPLEEGEDTGYRHYHAVVSFVRKRRFQAIQRWWPTAHCEVRRGTVQESIAYATKNGPAIFTHGSPDVENAPSKLATVCDWIDRKLTVQEMWVENRELFLRYAQYIQRVQRLLIPSYSGPRQVMWFYGPPGSGKTYRARLCLPDAPVVTLEGMWVHNYDGQTDVVLDELRLSDTRFNNLLSLTGDCPVAARVLHGTIGWNARRIIITSPSHPRDCPTTCADDRIEQLFRRIRCILRFYGVGEFAVENGQFNWTD